jgi:hypothetical protein
VTSSGNVLTLEGSTSGKPVAKHGHKVAARLVTDRLFDITASPGANMSGDLSFGQIEAAVEAMLTEGTLKVEVVTK